MDERSVHLFNLALCFSDGQPSDTNTAAIATQPFGVLLFATIREASRDLDDVDVWYCDKCDKTRIDDKKARENHRKTCGFPEAISINPISALLKDAHLKEIRKLPRRQGRQLIEPQTNRWLSNYRIDDKFILKQASSSQFSTNAVTEFTDKVFNLYNISNTSALAEGKKQELAMDNVWKLRQLPVADIPNYKLLYRDEGDNSKIYDISSLQVNSKPLRGKPDLVFLNKQRNEILIVERKWTRGTIPKDGWPNLRAQLWTYAQIDDFKVYDKIHLRAEIWDKTTLHNRQHLSKYTTPALPVVLSFEFPDLHRVWLTVFDKMGGLSNN